MENIYTKKSFFITRNKYKISIIIDFLDKWDKQKLKFLNKVFYIRISLDEYIRNFQIDPLKIFDIPKDFSLSFINNIKWCNKDLDSNYDALIKLTKIINKKEYIKYLDLSGNRLGLNEKSFESLIKLLRKLNLLKLNLSNNNLSNPLINDRLITDNLKKISDVLKTYDSISSVNLKGNNLGSNPEGFEVVCNTLLTINSLKKINISENNLGENFNSFSYLCKNLIVNSTITNINLGSNNILCDIKLTKLLINVLQSNKTITSLGLTCNSKIDRYPKYFKEFIHNGMKENISITCLDISGLEINNFQSIFVDYIKVNRTITDLNLNNMNFGKNISVFTTILTGIKLNSSIRKLSLENNKLSKNKKCLDSILKLKNHKSLQFLNLKRNNLNQDLRAMDFILDLIIHSEIDELDLRDNNLNKTQSLNILLYEISKIYNKNVKIIY